jgi:hypothetical protein
MPVAEDGAMDPIPVEAFLERYPERIRRAADALRAIVHAAVPDAVEALRPGWGVIGYNAPAGRRSPYIGCVFAQPEHAHLLFEYGVLMDDPDGVLEGEGTTRQVRWLTFERPEDVAARRDELIGFVREAVRVASMSRGERQLLAMSREG